MRAVVQERYGTGGVWRVGELPVPEPGPGEVLVRVAAAALDRGTWHLMAGLPLAVRPAVGLRAPRVRVPGRDLAGDVVAVGPGVDGFGPGDRVFGTTPSGSLAEYAVAPADRLAHAPDGCGPELAAAVPVSGQTAWQAVHRVGRVTQASSVLVLGASGGVGTFAVQIARAAGATVTAVCRTGSVGLVRSLGATDVVDRTTTDVFGLGRRFDVVLDIGGTPSAARLCSVLAPGGTAVLVGGERPDARLTGGYGRLLRAAALSPFLRGRRLAVLVADENAADLAALRGLVEAGELTPVVDRTVGLDDADAAIERLAAGRVRGKIVVRVAGPSAPDTAGTGASGRPGVS
ncbi:MULTISPECIES: NAD(P)-dependent alcohol dehydrogenase [unclassified Pseudonocardia]|uniref:NAD(P)-dependent alcohol dehydrogenase n=1 Tax=unclassified Pseudonocardia TaxID=2619320 RepID=UPI001CF6FBE8|nr:NAD(P)-dependent alcohol dehydrogenase [Pseudonocardia sp. ICBG601]